MNSISFNFSHICQIYVVELLIIHFCRHCHLRFLSSYDYQSEVNFWGVNFISGYISSSNSIQPELIVQFQSHICLTIGKGGQLHLWIHFQLCLSQYYLLYIYISHIFYFSSAILIPLDDNLELTVLC